METSYLKIVVEKDIPSLDTTIARRIHRAIQTKLTTKPLLYGLPLRGDLHQYWKLRIGDYRVIYTVLNNKIIIVGVGHRKNIYALITGRI